MLTKGKCYQNKYGNPPVRILEEIYHGKKQLLSVEPSGHVSTIPSAEHNYEEISYWKWLSLTVPRIAKWFWWVWQYRQDKKLGLVEIMTPSDYWKKHPPGYKTSYVPVTEYGFLTTSKKVTTINYPVWRERYFYPHFEVELDKWLWRRIKHILPTPLLK